MLPAQRNPWLPTSDKNVPPEWAVTFADMMCLLLTFFVLIASYSYTDASKYRALAGSLRRAFGSREPQTGLSLPISKPGQQEAGRLGAEVEAEITALADSSAQGALQVVRSQEGMRLRVQEGVMFDLGRADLRDQARDLLDRLGPILRRYPGTIWVEGHTDDLPIQSAAYPSNWELSAARAGNVVRALVASGVPPGHLAAVGYAETHPLAPNSDPESRQRNRRVEFLLTRTLPLAP
jgi:chemotaxis protein MotB